MTIIFPDTANNQFNDFILQNVTKKLTVNRMLLFRYIYNFKNVYLCCTQVYVAFCRGS